MTIPTIAQIKAQIITDIETQIGTTIPILPKAFIRVLATALAGVISVLYRFAQWVYRQIFTSSADDAALVARAAEYAIVRNPAISAVLVATVPGTNGVTIPEATLWTGPQGAVYEQEDAATIATGTATVSLIAVEPGALGNLENGEVLALASPVIGVTGTATVTSRTVEGEDEEDIEDFRTRLEERIRFRPGVGSAADYIRWAREVSGIVKAFAFNTAPGEVTVYPLEDITGANRIPDAGKLAEVAAYLQDPTRRPLCADVYAVAMDELVVDVAIATMTPDTAALRLLVEAAIETHLYTRYPRQYTDDEVRNVISPALLYAAATAAGAQSLALTMEIDSTPSTGHTLLDNEIAALGTVTWS